jgi:hypothetical protein
MNRVGGENKPALNLRTSMPIKTIPLSRLEANLKETLNECADSGQALVVELPDHRLIAIAAVDSPANNESLVDDLLHSNPAFQELVAKSKAGPRRPFVAK